LTGEIVAAAPARTRVQRLSARAELAWVLVPTVGLLTVVSFLRLWRQGGEGQLVLSDWRLWSVVVQVLVLTLPIAAFLRRRGWRWADMSEPLVLRDALRGAGVWLYTALIYYGLRLAVWLIWPRASTEAFTMDVSGAFSWAPALAAVVLDPIAEELLWLGYIVNALRHRGIWFAVVVSIGLRTMVHAYQGPLALIGVLPIGVMFTRYYLRTRRLGPVMVAHIIQDLLAFTILSLHQRGA
jgi:membrane protease YdiL (CAAX protease family)